MPFNHIKTLNEIFRKNFLAHKNAPRRPLPFWGQFNFERVFVRIAQ